MGINFELSCCSIFVLEDEIVVKVDVFVEIERENVVNDVVLVRV